MMSRLTKVAQIQHDGYPVGTPAPMYLDCPCNAKPDVPEDGETVTCDCGVEYDARGWIVASAPSTVASYALIGIDAHPVTVRCDIRRGPARLAFAGLRKVSAKEMAVRVASAFASMDLPLPSRNVEVTISPADLNQLATTALDLAVACAVLLADGANLRAMDGLLVLGELGLDGHVRQVRGVLAACALAQSQGMRGAIVPRACAGEACMVDGLTIYPVDHLLDVVAHLSGEHPIAPARASRAVSRPLALDMGDIRGQAAARRALEIAAAGGHSLLLEGPPGTGKTMIARRLPTILPPMTREEEIDTLRVFSACGLSGQVAGGERPWRAPHHTISQAALIGGGTTPHPGEISLAHNGVLFLDELPEFSSATVQALRAPLRDRVITLARSSNTVTMPAAVHLIAAANPCPCGWRGSDARECTCSPAAVERYSQRAESLMGAFDMRVTVAPVALVDLRTDVPGEPSEAVRARVVAARERQRARLQSVEVTGVDTNAAMSDAALFLTCELDDTGLVVLDDVAGYVCPDGADCGDPTCAAGSKTQRRERILRVARTIADLTGARDIAPEHITEAASLV